VYGACSVFFAGKSPNIRPFTAHIKKTVLANPSMEPIMMTAFPSMLHAKLDTLDDHAPCLYVHVLCVRVLSKCVCFE